MSSTQRSKDSINLDYMINQIFSEEPQTPHFYHLDLEENEGPSVENETRKQIRSKNTANILMTIFFNGCKKLFGESVGPNNMTKEQFELVDKYIMSFGYTTRYEFETDDQNVPVSLQIWFEKLL
jgi:hypothetical protein